MDDRGALPVLAAVSSPDVVAARLQVLADALDAPQPLGTFTDEELLGLEDPTGNPSAPSPWWSSLPEPEARTAVTAALRGLTARGLYRATPRDAELLTWSIEADVQLLALMSLRQQVAAVVVAERRTATTLDWVLLYAQRAGLWLAETIAPTGQHEFVLATAPAQTVMLLDWCGALPDRPAPDFTLTVGRAQLAEDPCVLGPVGDASLTTLLTRYDLGWDPADGSVGPAGVVESWSGVYSGTAGSYVSTVADDGCIRYRGAAREDVAGLLTHLLRLAGAP